MHTFLQHHAKHILGVLSGFDRLVFRGTIRGLTRPQGMAMFLSVQQVLLKDYKSYVQAITDKIKQATERLTAKRGRPIEFLRSPSISKEETARRIATRDGIRDGLICVLSAVEPCFSFEIYRNRETHMLELHPRWRKCLYYYHYWMDPVWGFMHARLQSWFPFNIQVGLNGREWLERSLIRQHIPYLKRDNCFPWVHDPIRVQHELDAQLRTDWARRLDAIAVRLNPVHAEIFQAFPVNYYWSVYQSEWATDVLFQDRAALEALYPSLIRHGITSFSSPDVLRFLGRKVPASGSVPGHLQAAITSDLKRRPEGVRIKHRLGANSIKAYDKQGSILRVETTINESKDFRVYRPKEGGAPEDKAWRPMRRGVADLHRRAQVSQAANERYLAALAVVEQREPLGQLAERLCRPVRWHGQRQRALNPYADQDAALLEAINRGEYAINGFRNRDLRTLLYPTAQSPEQRRRYAAAVTRRLRLLRAHKLIRKVSHTHRYQVTPAGRRAITALLAARNSDIKQLTSMAA